MKHFQNRTSETISIGWNGTLHEAKIGIAQSIKSAFPPQTEIARVQSET